MPLTIQGATVGYDAAGIDQLKQDIHMKCVEEAKNDLDSNYNTLEEAIDQIWVGQSAERFKDNMKSDVKSVKKALDECYKVFEGELNAIASEMTHVDAQLIERR